MGLISNGTTIFDNGAMAVGGSLVFLSSATASSSANISFTSGIDSTYKEYVFYFVNMHPASDNVNFTFNGSTDGGSNYNVTKTTTYFKSQNREDGAGGSLGYETANDLAQSTGFQNITEGLGADNDQCANGMIKIFNPSSTTFVKHFIAETSYNYQSDRAYNTFISGYFNTTSAVNAIRFQMSSGNIDDGKILMFGVN